MAITQRQIAEQLGLSPQAVNFALGHRSDQVSPATRSRVLAAARKLGYRANAAAAAVATGRFNAVGLVMSTHHTQSTVVGQLLRGIHDRFDQCGIHLTVNFVDDDRLTSDDDLPKILGQAMVDGLLLNYTHAIPPHMIELIQRHRLPAVWINSKQPANSVGPDDEGAGHTATRLLLDAGHRRITYIDLTAAVEDADEIHYSHADRRAGYERAMREAGIEPLAVSGWRRHLTHEAAVAEAGRLLDSPGSADAFVGYCQHDAAALQLAARQRGLDLGPDLSLVIIDHHQPLIGARIDTLLLPEYDIGAAAAAMLMARIERPGEDQPSVVIPMIHKPGETISRAVSS